MTSKTMKLSVLPFQGGSFVVVLCCMVLVSEFGDVSPYVVHIIFSSVWVAEWPLLYLSF